MLRLITITAAFLASSAFAQTPQPQGSPEILALQAKLMQELSGALQCSTQFIALQQREAVLSADLVKAQARIKELEAKQEPKPDAK